jgi:transposase
MRTKGSIQELEVRRRIAGRMLSQKYSVAEVAAAVGASESSVRRWRLAMRQGGLKALQAKPHGGKKPLLSDAQRKQLVGILLAGPLAAGFHNDLWTCPRVAQVIERRFGVRYHPDHVWKLLDKLGWSCQRPEQRAREGNEQKIRRWRTRDWPRIKKERAAAS